MSVTVVPVPPARVHVGGIPAWDMNDLVSRHCPVCDEGDAQPLCRRPDGLVVEVCGNCGMMYLGKVPSSRQQMAYYQTYAARKGYTKTRPLSWLECATACAKDLYIEALEQTGGIRNHRVLDVGCATGGFLQLIRFKGGSAEGVEIDEPARREAHRRGFKVTDTLPAGEPYDVICAFQTLEHLQNPAEMLAAMARLTKPGGRLLLATPNGSEVAKLGRDWLGFRVDLEHFNYFTVASMAELLRRHGFLIEHFWEHRQPTLVRTDIPPDPGPLTLRRHLRQRFNRWSVAMIRALSASPERFLQGTFVLSLLARKA